MRANIEHAVLWTGRANVIGGESGAQVRPRITAIAAALERKVSSGRARERRGACHGTAGSR